MPGAIRSGVFPLPAAHNGNHFTRLDGERHIVEGLAPASVLADVGRQIAHPDGPRRVSGRGRQGAICGAEGPTGIEPAPSVWKTEALPLSYGPEAGNRPATA